MKRYLFFLLILTLVVSGCGGEGDGEAENEAQGDSEETVSLNLSTPDPDSSPITQAANEFASVVEEKSEGTIEIEVHPNGNLYGGDASAAVNQLGEGSLDMLVLSTSIYANFEPKFNAMSVPYLFDDNEQFISYLNSDLAEELLSDLNQNLGITGLGYWSREFRQITNSSNPIEEPSDLEGLSLRVPNNPLWVEFFEGAGANPSPMDFSEVYNALQLGTIDGQENPLGVIVSSNMYEVQDYLTISNHMAEGWIMGVNEDKFDNLSDNQQQILREATEELQAWKIENDLENAQNNLEFMESEGVEVNEITEENRQQFIEISQESYSDFKQLVEDDEYFDAVLEFTGKSE